MNYLIRMIICVIPLIALSTTKTVAINPDGVQFQDFYQSISTDMEGNFKEPNLPLTKNMIQNKELIPLVPYFKNQDNLSKLLKNGFLVVPERKYDTFSKAYIDSIKEMPSYITADFFLHYFHVFFDHTLMEIEENYLYEDLLDLIVSMQAYLEKMEGASQRGPGYILALDYLTIAGSCLDPEYKTAVSDEVSAELRLIAEKREFSLSPLLRYYEDYSQYKPRGHYTKSSK